jgi:hypothetical protein
MIEDLFFKFIGAIFPQITIKYITFAMGLALLSGAAISFFLEWRPDEGGIYEYH